MLLSCDHARIRAWREVREGPGQGDGRRIYLQHRISTHERSEHDNERELAAA